MGQIDCSSIPPNQRPQIGERVKIISGPRQGYEGIVVGYKDKKTEMKRRKIIVRFLTDEKDYSGFRAGTAYFMRSELGDSDGNPLPEYQTLEETERAAMIKQERIEQYKRLEEAMEENGYDLEDYLRYSIGTYTVEVHHEDIEKLKNGEERIDRYFDEDICEGLGFGLDWILYADEKCRAHPCGDQMKRYLNWHPERREIVWQWMMSDGYRVEDYYEEMRKRDEIEFGDEYEDFKDGFDED